MVAVGCDEGLWFGLRDDRACASSLPSSAGRDSLTWSFGTALRRVLDVPKVTQCAVLQDLNLLLILADKVCPSLSLSLPQAHGRTFLQSLFAYPIARLVQPPDPSDKRPVRQKLSGKKDVHLFTVGSSNGMARIVFMTRKGVRPSLHNQVFLGPDTPLR